MTISAAACNTFRKQHASDDVLALANHVVRCNLTAVPQLKTVKGSQQSNIFAGGLSRYFLILARLKSAWTKNYAFANKLLTTDFARFTDGNITIIALVEQCSFSFPGA